MRINRLDSTQLIRSDNIAVAYNTMFLELQIRLWIASIHHIGDGRPSDNRVQPAPAIQFRGCPAGSLACSVFRRFINDVTAIDFSHNFQGPGNYVSRPARSIIDRSPFDKVVLRSKVTAHCACGNRPEFAEITSYRFDGRRLGKDISRRRRGLFC